MVKVNYPEAFYRFECHLCLLLSFNHLLYLNKKFLSVVAHPLLIQLSLTDQDNING